MEWSLCKYKNLFGNPGQGIRKYRILNIAIMDTVVVIIFGLIISYFTGYNVWLTLAILFISGIIAHRMFCVRTGLDQLLFSE
jgi:fatty acid desaturase